MDVYATDVVCRGGVGWGPSVRACRLTAGVMRCHEVSGLNVCCALQMPGCDAMLCTGADVVVSLIVPPQVPDCAEVCQHYLEDCSMDWPVALTLVHLQHKHQQEQQHQHHQHQQQQQQQLQQAPGSLPRNSSSGSSVASARRQGPVGRSSLHGRSSKGAGLLRGLGASGANALEAVAPLLPVPHDSVYLQVGRGQGAGGGRTAVTQLCDVRWQWAAALELLKCLSPAAAVGPCCL